MPFDDEAGQPRIGRPLVRQALTEADLTSITPEARAYALRPGPSET